MTAAVALNPIATVLGSVLLLAALLVATVWYLGLLSSSDAPEDAPMGVPVAAPSSARSEAAAEARRLLDRHLETQRLTEQEKMAAWEPQRPSAEDLAIQQARCKDVKAQCVDAARRMQAAAGEEALAAALADLTVVYDQNESDGALGVLAMTELCNALLETDTLELLKSLQEHANPQIARRSSTIFQHVIPRIWSF